MSQQDPFQSLVDALRRTFTINPPPPPVITSSSPAPAIPTVSTVPSPSSPVFTSPMARPAPYSGSVEDCSGFILQCELVLEMQPHLYPTETAKIAFLISQLTGKALKWADSIWSQHGEVTQSYSAFISHFQEVFGKSISDSSAGEKLYQLKQGVMSIHDYALQFRTLAASSGWNEQALITTFRQGLEPRVRLHLAAYEDSIGLEKFIQLAIRSATRMHACLQEHQDQSLPTSLLRRSEPVSTPEPAPEPMEFENSRLTSSERQRRLTLNLCLYCGAPGHAISACPTRPPRPMVSAIIPSLRKMKPLTTVLNLTAAGISLTVVALLDSGSAGNFISGTLCRQLRLKTSPSPTIYQISSITGKPLSRKHVRRVVGPIQLQVGLLHREQIHLLVLEDSTADVVLGRPWLEQHNPSISWRTGEILKWGETCFSHCFSELPIPRASSKELSVCATSIESPVEKRSMEIPELAMPTTMLGLLGVLLCALAVSSGVTPQPDFNIKRMAGKWYLIGIATSDEWFVTCKADLKMGVAMLTPTDEGDLEMAYSSLNPDGTCWRMNQFVNKLDFPGIFSFHSKRWKTYNITFVDVKYDEYVLIHTVKTKDGSTTVDNKSVIVVQAKEVEGEIVVDKVVGDASLVALAQAELELAPSAATVAAMRLAQIVQQLVDVGVEHKNGQAVQWLIDAVTACGLVQTAPEMADVVAVPENRQAEQAEQLWGAMNLTVAVQQMVSEAVALAEKIHELNWVAACLIVTAAAEGARDRVIPHSVGMRLQSQAALMQSYSVQGEKDSGNVHKQEF
ncbi:Retrotransposon-derived protein PEG10 [Anabarilius grahami]|uniref:Retrotransposon-derived protein PEG10 n=1 Tax=Anabarilius grahami TaxID=495550 RepID=A0A3N0Z625_ANAGA|nr:Retrotransposon-derived protein PEG10 [Anabarilius grahami]